MTRADIPDGVLDIFHVIEHLTTTSKALLGDPDDAKAWAGCETRLAKSPDSPSPVSRHSPWEESLGESVVLGGRLDVFTGDNSSPRGDTGLGESGDTRQVCRTLAGAELAGHTLLHDGWVGIEALGKAAGHGLDHGPVALPLHASPLRPATQPAALHELRNDLAPHAHHLNDAERLREGRSIGSGQIEGACKNMIGRRRTANAAR